MLAMIKCPKCNASLPVNYVTCHFCGADVSQVPRPAVKEEQRVAAKAYSPGTLKGLYAVASFYLLLGAFEACAGIGLFGDVGDFMKTIYIAFGVLIALVGIGMLFRSAFLYPMMPMFCFLQMILGVVFIIAAFMTVQAAGLKYGLVAAGALQTLSAGLMFYYAEETATITISAS